jgi:hypothetical protein
MPFHMSSENSSSARSTISNTSSWESRAPVGSPADLHGIDTNATSCLSSLRSSRRDEADEQRHVNFFPCACAARDADCCPSPTSKSQGRENENGNFSYRLGAWKFIPAQVVRRRAVRFQTRRKWRPCAAHALLLILVQLCGIIELWLHVTVVRTIFRACVGFWSQRLTGASSELARGRSSRCSCQARRSASSSRSLTGHGRTA